MSQCSTCCETPCMCRPARDPDAGTVRDPAFWTRRAELVATAAKNRASGVSTSEKKTNWLLVVEGPGSAEPFNQWTFHLYGKTRTEALREAHSFQQRHGGGQVEVLELCGDSVTVADVEWAAEHNRRRDSMKPGPAFASLKGIERLDVRPADITTKEAVAALIEGRLVAVEFDDGIQGGTNRVVLTTPTGPQIGLIRDGFVLVREANDTWTAILPAGGQTTLDIPCETLREAVEFVLAYYKSALWRTKEQKEKPR